MLMSYFMRTLCQQGTLLISHVIDQTLNYKVPADFIAGKEHCFIVKCCICGSAHDGQELTKSYGSYHEPQLQWCIRYYIYILIPIYKSTKILAVNLFAFAYRLFHEDFSSIYRARGLERNLHETACRQMQTNMCIKAPQWALYHLWFQNKPELYKITTNTF